MIQQLCSSGFPIRVRIEGGGHFGKIDKNLRKITKSTFFGKTVGGMRGQANFWGSGGFPSNLPSRGNLAHSYGRNQETKVI